MDISEFASLISEYGRNISIDEFNNNDILRWGLLKYLENIGEAASQVSKSTKEEFNTIEWRTIVAARNIYVHEYFAIEWPLVWQTLKTIDFRSIQVAADGIVSILRERHGV